ncbi:hypothetical protein SB8_05545 [Pseudomonas oryzihabitans]|nr:hypothetical protein SB8_05545 [Pseudomonas psychrotolerans]
MGTTHWEVRSFQPKWGEESQKVSQGALRARPISSSKTRYVPYYSNIINSYTNGYVSELKLANEIAGLPDQQVLKYGDAIGRHGADVISVDVKTGEVTLWDSKYRSGDVKLGESPTFTKDVSRNFAIAEAERAISESKLSDGIKNKSLLFLEIRAF